MKTQYKPPRILILTQIHPLNIGYLYNEICSEYIEYNEVFSPQIMALLGELSLKENENDFKHSYRVLNAAFVKHIKVAIEKMNPLKPWIFIGNCAKDSVKFDYILGFDGGADFGNNEIFDRYIDADNKQLTEKNLQINYYTKDDAEHFFPTVHHLKLFLNTLGIKRKEETDGTNPI